MDGGAREAEAYQLSLLPRSVFNPRAATTLLQTALLTPWLGAPWALCWFVSILCLETLLNPFLVHRFVTPLHKRDPARARACSAAIIFLGATAHTLGWASAWLIGGPSASLLAVAWLATSVANSLTYFANSRLQFAACLAPTALICVIIPLVQHSAAPWLIGIAAATVLLALLQAREARDFLSATLAKSRAERRTALQSSRAKSQFIATMSHELRTPLNAIIGYAEIIQEDQSAAGGEESARDAARIRRAADHLLGLITEILDFSKIEAGKMEITLAPASVADLIAEAVETVTPMAAPAGNRISVTIGPEIDRIVTDAQKVRQCLLNLLSNACKFTEAGLIRIEARLNHAGMLQIAVSDTGCGVTPEQAELLFQPFVQADGSFTRRQDGAGLGLVITKRFAQLLGGDLVMESAPRVGSTFTMTLPVATMRETPIPSAANLADEDSEAA